MDTDHVPTENVEPTDPSVEPIPVKGMVFETDVAAQEFYRNYARGRGFDIKRCFSYKTKHENFYTRVMFACASAGYSKAGVNADGSPVVKRFGASRKTGCGAMMRIARQNEQSSWHISEFRDTHNHELVSPSKNRYLKVNRHLPDQAKSMAVGFDRERIPKCKIRNLFGGDGPSGGFNDRDIYNYMRTLRKSTLVTRDAVAVLDRFREIKRLSPEFFWAAQTDEEDRLANLFWIDARSRSAYRRFGEVICFDTTYRTNKYKLPFAPFTGLNHHWQCIMFGFALLQDETEDTFIWLFKRNL